VQAQWALSHPISLLAVEALVAPALRDGASRIALADVDAFVTAHVGSASPESRRKTRTVLLAALEGVGAMVTRGTGQHRSLAPARGRPHPLTFAYLLRRGGTTGDLASSLPVRLTQCELDHARACLAAGAVGGPRDSETTITA